jgi:TldD protein
MKQLDLKKYRDQFTGYTELRVQENRDCSIVMVDGSVVKNSTSSESGVSARSYCRGSWGFASSPEINEGTIKSIVQTASGNALFLDRHESRGEPELPVSFSMGEWDLTTKAQVSSQKNRIGFVKEIDAYIKEKFTKISSRTVVINGLDMEKQLITSTGSIAYSMTPRCLLYTVLSVNTKSGPVELFDVAGSTGQFEDIFVKPSLFYEKREYSPELGSVNAFLMPTLPVFLLMRQSATPPRLILCGEGLLQQTTWEKQLQAL